MRGLRSKNRYGVLDDELRWINSSPLVNDRQQPDAATGSSCFGPAGERALFESLAAGREGAFVAWVKGGHEIRQECKVAVTDVLELLAVPKGQKESFFRRGQLQQRTPGGGGGSRVGIAANLSK